MSITPYARAGFFRFWRLRKVLGPQVMRPALDGKRESMLVKVFPRLARQGD
jgi:hypothetical protein